MKISVIGTGYVGLVAGACLSDTGNHVSCIDVDHEKVARLQRGELPIYEPGLDDIVARNIRAKRIAFLTDGGEALRRSDVIFIAVGTPPAEDGSSDLRYVLSAVQTVAESVDRETVLVLKSTVPVGTAAKVKEIAKALSPEEQDQWKRSILIRTAFGLSGAVPDVAATQLGSSSLLIPFSDGSLVVVPTPSGPVPVPESKPKE